MSTSSRSFTAAFTLRSSGYQHDGIMMQRQNSTAPVVQHWRSQPPLSCTAVARLVQFAGAFDVLTALQPPRHSRIALLVEFVPAAGILSARAATAAIGLLLVYLGSGLRRGKVRAWQVAVALAGAGVVLHLAKGLDYDAAAVSAALLGLLIAVRGQFRALADPRNRWRALAALIGFGMAGFLLGLLEIAVRMNRLEGHPGWPSWAEESALGLLGISGPLQFARPLGAEAVSYTTGAFGLLAVGAATVLLLRPGDRLPERTDADDRSLRDLLHRYGSDDSLGYFALREDKLLIWASSAKAAVAYRVINGVSLASGDPIGAESAWPDAIGAWLADCAQHGWTPAVLGCGHAGGKAYRRSGLDVVELGDEALIDVAAFRLDGRPVRAVRQAVARIRRAGYTCEVARQRDLTPAVLAGAARAADAFRDGRLERGFSMALSRLGDPRDGDCLFVLARDAEGHIRGLLHFVPWGADGLSLDLMRGDRTARNGLTEFMVVSTLEAAPALAVRRVSLNFAVLRSVFARAEELGAGPVLRLWHRLLKAASRLWQIESLYRANAKYQPTWQPRYLCFPTARDLPRIAVAALSAEAFLPAGWSLSRNRHRDASPAPLPVARLG
jgi:lysyl-tRNA synthetase class 2